MATSSAQGRNMQGQLILHKPDGKSVFVPRSEWETVLDYEDVVWEKLKNGERLVRNGQTIGVFINRRK